jgi:tRNA(fMet)-specific endonuclease VapC
VILDTNALSAFVDGHEGVGEVLGRQARAAIPVIVLGEYRFGIAAARHRAEYEDWLASELQHFDVLAVTAETTLSYATVRTRLKRAGTPIPANDAWIAALALQYGMPVLSRDPHFDVVAGLVRQPF